MDEEKPGIGQQTVGFRPCLSTCVRYVPQPYLRIALRTTDIHNSKMVRVDRQGGRLLRSRRTLPRNDSLLPLPTIPKNSFGMQCWELLGGGVEKDVGFRNWGSTQPTDCRSGRSIRLALYKNWHEDCNLIPLVTTHGMSIGIVSVQTEKEHDHDCWIWWEG